MVILKRIFILVFPLLFMIVVVRSVNGATEEFSTNKYFTYLQSNIEVDYEKYVESIKDVRDELNKIQPLKPISESTPSFFPHSDFLNQLNFFNKFKNYLDYLIYTIKALGVNAYTYAKIGILYSTHTSYYAFKLVYNILDTSLYVLGFN